MPAAHASEVHDLTKQLNNALNGCPCTSDLSSESVILLLEQLLVEKSIVSDTHYQLFVEWAQGASLECIGHEASLWEAALVGLFGSVAD